MNAALGEEHFKVGDDVVELMRGMAIRSNNRQRDNLIKKYQGYVDSVAFQLMRALHLPQEMLEEFISCGYLGLVEAADRFDPASGVEFKAFAYLRIRGAIIDGIRRSTEVSGRTYHMAKAFQAVQDLRERETEDSLQNVGSSAKDSTHQLAEVLNFLAKSALVYRLSTSDQAVVDTPDDSVESSPGGTLECKEERSLLREIVTALPEKERRIIEEYYFNEKSFVEIAAQADSCSKSWVSRLHARALEHIKEKYLEELAK